MEKARPIGYADVKMYVASAVAEMHKRLIEDANKAMMEAFIIPTLPAIDYTPMAPVTLTAKMSKVDSEKIYNMLDEFLNGVYRGMKRKPTCEWFDE